MNEDTAASAAETPAAPAPVESAPAAPPAASSQPLAASEQPDDAPIVIDEAEEPAAPPAVEAADPRDPWGLARHEAHKEDLAHALPPRPELPEDREVTFDEFRALFEERLQAVVRLEYQEYLADLRAHAKRPV